MPASDVVGPSQDISATTRYRAFPVPSTLLGDYRVADIDGEPYDGPYGMDLTIGSETIDFDNCEMIGWQYRYDSGYVQTERATAVVSDGTFDLSGCEEPQPYPLLTMVDVLDQVERVVKTPENGIELSGGGHSVTLFTQ